MRDEHRQAIGALIARLREQQGWSQRALAKWVGLDQSAVSRIEAGRRRVSADELQRFADALRVSADALLQRAGGDRRRRAPSLGAAESAGRPRGLRVVAARAARCAGARCAADREACRSPGPLVHEPRACAPGRASDLDDTFLPSSRRLASLAPAEHPDAGASQLLRLPPPSCPPRWPPSSQTGSRCASWPAAATSRSPGAPGTRRRASRSAGAPHVAGAHDGVHWRRPLRPRRPLLAQRAARRAETARSPISSRCWRTATARR